MQIMIELHTSLKIVNEVNDFTSSSDEFKDYYYYYYYYYFTYS